MSDAPPGPGMIRLLALRSGETRIGLPAVRTLADWHQALATEIAAHLTPEHAALFAVPVADPTVTTWFAPGSALRRFAELAPEDRNRLNAATGTILSDIRRLAEGGAAPAVAAAWPALRSVPNLTCLFAVDGRPVLAAWGFATSAVGGGPLAALDDGRAWRAPSRVPWLVYGVALAALALLALFAGLLLGPLTGSLVPVAAACRVAPGQLALLMEQSRQAARAKDLRDQLSQLVEGHGERALQCPIPHQTVAPPAPVEPPAPPPAPTRRSALPQDQWDKHNPAFLEGCWDNFSDMRLQEMATHIPHDVKSWKFCFDAHGQGWQMITLDNGARCRNDLAATFGSDNTLRVTSKTRCPFPHYPLYRGRLTCHRESDDEAICVHRDIEGPQAGRGQGSTGRFRRAPANEQPGGTDGRGGK